MDSKGPGQGRGGRRTVEFVARMHAAGDDRHVLDNCQGARAADFPQHADGRARDAIFETAFQYTSEVSAVVERVNRKRMVAHSAANCMAALLQSLGWLTFEGRSS